VIFSFTGEYLFLLSICHQITSFLSIVYLLHEIQVKVKVKKRQKPILSLNLNLNLLFLLSLYSVHLPFCTTTARSSSAAAVVVSGAYVNIAFCPTNPLSFEIVTNLGSEASRDPHPSWGRD